MAMTMMAAPSAKAATLLDSIGIKGDALAKAMRSGGLLGAITMLKTHLDGLSKTKAAATLAGIFGVRSSTAVMTLVSNLQDYNRVQDQITAKSGTFGAALAAEQQTTSAKWHKFISAIEADAVKWGNVMLPWARALPGLWARSLTPWATSRRAP